MNLTKMGAGDVGVWDWTYPRLARKAEERKNFALHKRGSIEEVGEAHELYLLFFRTRDATEETKVSIGDLQSGKSENDRGLKLVTAGLLAILSLAPAYTPLLDELVSGFTSVLSLTEDDPAALVRGVTVVDPIFAICILVTIIAIVIFAALSNRFTVMDANWEKSIRQSLDPDMPNKMQGIRQLMLDFRRFIKWRRFMNYVLFVAVLMLALQPVFALGSSIASRELKITWSPAEQWAYVAFVALFTLSIARYSFSRWYYTNWRDPTAQLCVMAAEVQRDAIALRRAR